MPANDQRKPATRVEVQDAYARRYLGWLDRLTWHRHFRRVKGIVQPRKKPLPKMAGTVREQLAAIRGRRVAFTKTRWGGLKTT